MSGSRTIIHNVQTVLAARLHELPRNDIRVLQASLEHKGHRLGTNSNPGSLVGLAGTWE